MLQMDGKLYTPDQWVTIERDITVPTSDGESHTERQLVQVQIGRTTDVDRQMNYITEVTDTSPAADERFYLNGNPNTPRDLAQLKAQWVVTVNGLAGDLLKPFDWYYIRKVREGVDAPAGVTSHCNAIRARANVLTDSINAANSVDILASIVSGDLDWPTLQEA